MDEGSQRLVEETHPSSVRDGAERVRQRVKRIRPFRIVWRLVAYVLWTALVYVAVRAALVLALVWKTPGKRWARELALRWGYGVGHIIGMRVKVEGTPPTEPYLLVSNHVVWIDGFAMSRCARCRYVGMAEIQTMPIVRTIIRGVDPIYVYRKKEDTARVVCLMVEALERGESLYMCPEAVVSPGRDVRRFHAALFEAAIQRKMPVHCATITYTTPPDCPPPSQCILFGPDPHYRDKNGNIPQEEIDAWGPERSALRYLVNFLSCRTHTVTIRFGDEAISGEDKFELANATWEAVRRKFTPVD